MPPRRSLSALLLTVPFLCLGLLGSAPLQDGSNAPAASRFAGRTVVVTGANRGLGLEFATQYMAAGARVVGTARTPDEARELVATGARVLQLDVTDEASVAAFAEALGDGPVHLLINNAGTSGRSLPETLSRAERTTRVMDVNTFGPMRVTEAVLPNLLASGEGATVVNISSRLGSIAENDSGRYIGYRESKAALNMYSRSLANEHRDAGLLVIPVSPGWVRTDMGGPDAPLSPEQSVGGLVKVIEGLDAEDSGRFLNHDGAVLRW
jgi:NAD(P)-dependent dehydrogenase (short-subunit alcohol dehydrogenase family)